MAQSPPDKPKCLTHEQNGRLPVESSRVQMLKRFRRKLLWDSRKK